MAIDILVVEDEYTERQELTQLLETVTPPEHIRSAATCSAAIAAISQLCPDLILLDIMLPGMDGSEILKEIRKKSNAPVIMVTARDSIHDQLLNFANGADDYITKPYALAIVKVHIEAILKRAGKQKERVEVGHIAVEPDTWRVYVDEKAIETTPKEYELLSYLIKNKNVVMTRDSILESVWGYDYSGDTRTVDTLVKQLRRKIAPYGSYIRSVYGVGYIFEGEENETAEA